MRLSAPLTGLASGLLGTTAMTLSMWAERRARPHLSGPVDYDASPHVVTAASTVLHWTPALKSAGEANVRPAMNEVSTAPCGPDRDGAERQIAAPVKRCQALSSV